MKINIIAILLLLLCSCGGGSDNEIVDFSGTWTGAVNARITSGGSECSYFAGEYPFEWKFVKSAEREFKIFRGEFELATAIIEPDNTTGRIDFLDLVNQLPDSGVTCTGADVIFAVINSNGQMELTYDGESSCQSVGVCHYQGEGTLDRIN